MPTYTESQKRAIYKYVDGNRVHINEYNKEWRALHAGEHNERRRNKYHYDCECARMRNILLN